MVITLSQFPTLWHELLNADFIANGLSAWQVKGEKRKQKAQPQRGHEEEDPKKLKQIAFFTALLKLS